MNQAEIKVSFDASNLEHITALNEFLSVVGSKKTTRKPRAPKEEAPKEEAPKETKEIEVKDSEQVTGKTIADVRKMLSDKVDENRPEIKKQLKKFGANNLTVLDPKHYDEMYAFMDKL